LNVLARIAIPKYALPWYAVIPPLSREIRRDVSRGRTFMNLSHWNEYTEAERRGFAVAISAADANKLMPPRQCVWVHRNARLSGPN
jgi:hypothetical protein